MSHHQPVISVGMPVYNGERYLAQAIETVLDQSQRDFELVISDNASTDRTESIRTSVRDVQIELGFAVVLVVVVMVILVQFLFYFLVLVDGLVRDCDLRRA